MYFLLLTYLYKNERKNIMKYKNKEQKREYGRNSYQKLKLLWQTKLKIQLELIIRKITWSLNMVVKNWNNQGFKIGLTFHEPASEQNTFLEVETSKGSNNVINRNNIITMKQD